MSRIIRSIRSPPIKIVIEQTKSPGNSPSNNNKTNNFIQYKLTTVVLSTLLTISETLPFLSNVKANGIVDIIKDLQSKLDSK